MSIISDKRIREILDEIDSQGEGGEIADLLRDTFRLRHIERAIRNLAKLGCWAEDAGWPPDPCPACERMVKALKERSK